METSNDAGDRILELDTIVEGIKDQKDAVKIVRDKYWGLLRSHQSKPTNTTPRKPKEKEKKVCNITTLLTNEEKLKEVIEKLQNDMLAPNSTRASRLAASTALRLLYNEERYKYVFEGLAMLERGHGELAASIQAFYNKLSNDVLANNVDVFFIRYALHRKLESPDRFIVIIGTMQAIHVCADMNFSGLFDDTFCITKIIPNIDEEDFFWNMLRFNQLDAFLGSLSRIFSNMCTKVQNVRALMQVMSKLQCKNAFYHCCSCLEEAESEQMLGYHDLTLLQTLLDKAASLDFEQMRVATLRNLILFFAKVTKLDVNTLVLFARYVGAMASVAEPRMINFLYSEIEEILYFIDYRNPDSLNLDTMLSTVAGEIKKEQPKGEQVARMLWSSFTTDNETSDEMAVEIAARMRVVLDSCLPNTPDDEINCVPKERVEPRPEMFFLYMQRPTAEPEFAEKDIPLLLRHIYSAVIHNKGTEKEFNSFIDPFLPLFEKYYVPNASVLHELIDKFCHLGMNVLDQKTVLPFLLFAKIWIKSPDLADEDVQSKMKLWGGMVAQTLLAPCKIPNFGVGIRESLREQLLRMVNVTKFKLGRLVFQTIIPNPQKALALTASLMVTKDNYPPESKLEAIRLLSELAPSLPWQTVKQLRDELLMNFTSNEKQLEAANMSIPYLEQYILFSINAHESYLKRRKEPVKKDLEVFNMFNFEQYFFNVEQGKLNSFPILSQFMIDSLEALNDNVLRYVGLDSLIVRLATFQPHDHHYTITEVAQTNRRVVYSKLYSSEIEQYLSEKNCEKFHEVNIKSRFQTILLILKLAEKSVIWMRILIEELKIVIKNGGVLEVKRRAFEVLVLMTAIITDDPKYRECGVEIIRCCSFHFRTSSYDRVKLLGEWAISNLCSKSIYYYDKLVDLFTEVDVTGSQNYAVLVSLLRCLIFTARADPSRTDWNGYPDCYQIAQIFTSDPVVPIEVTAKVLIRYLYEFNFKLAQEKIDGYEPIEQRISCIFDAMYDDVIVKNLHVQRDITFKTVLYDIPLMGGVPLDDCISLHMIEQVLEEKGRPHSVPTKNDHKLFVSPVRTQIFAGMSTFVQVVKPLPPPPPTN